MLELFSGTMRRSLLWVPIPVWLVFGATVAVFTLVPPIDLAVSALFYDPSAGFLSRGRLWEQLAYHSVAALMYGVNLGLILWCVVRSLRRVRSRRRCVRDIAYLLLLLALAPGLVVNALLKEHWGRARPVQVAELGGSRVFSPAFVRSDQRGGSFSSGHAAAAAYLVVVAWLMGGRRRALWLALAILYALIVGAARITAGGHFLSDVLTSYCVVALAAFLLYGSLFGEPLQRAHGHGSPRRPDGDGNAPRAQ